MSLAKVMKDTKKAVQLRADKVSSIVNEHTQRCKLILSQELSKDIANLDIKPFLFEVDEDAHLGWISGSKGYMSKTNRRQNPHAWVSSRKSTEFAEGLFPDMFKSVQQYAHHVANVLVGGDTTGYLARHLAFQYFLLILLGTYASGSGAGSRPLINDKSFERPCTLTRFLNQCLEEPVDDKKVFSKEVYVARFQKLSFVYWTRYITSQRSENPPASTSTLSPQRSEFYETKHPSQSNMSITRDEEHHMTDFNSPFENDMNPFLDDDMIDQDMFDMEFDHFSGEPKWLTSPPSPKIQTKQKISEYEDTIQQLRKSENELRETLNMMQNQYQQLWQGYNSLQSMCFNLNNQLNNTQTELNKYKSMFDGNSDQTGPNMPNLYHTPPPILNQSTQSAMDHTTDYDTGMSQSNQFFMDTDDIDIEYT